MRTLSEIAADGYRGMERATRDDGSTYVRVRDEAPAWLRDNLHEIHGTDMLPDDWRFEVIRDALGALDDSGCDDRNDADEVPHEIADSAVDTYNSDRAAWLASHLVRGEITDEAVAEFGGEERDTYDRIGLGQYAEALAIAYRVLGVVADAHEEQDDDDEDEDGEVVA